MNDLPPDPQRLRAILAHLDQQLADHQTVGLYLRLQRDTVREALTATEHRPSGPRQLPQPQRPALEAPAPASGYKLEDKLGPQHPLAPAIHVADCTMTQRRTRPISKSDARQALADPVAFRACEFCRPDTELGILEG